jgi:zinc protease
VHPRNTLAWLQVAALVAALAGPAVSAAGAAAPAPPPEDDVFPYPVHETTLDNGLQVVTVPYPSPGVVAYVTVVRTGSRQEVEPGYTGFAHFFEHMMFRGTERYSFEAYNDRLKRMGADFNAFTTADYTQYYVIGPAAELEAMMDLEADRFANLRYGEEAFRTEALAVLGEYNKGVASPFLPMWERLHDLAYQRHTYKHTTLGYYDYSLSFFDRFYRPENTIVLVVGDVEAARVDQLARRFYGGWQRGYRPVELPVEPPQDEPREAEIAWANPTRPYLMVGFHVPAFSPGEETAALDLVDQLLTSESAPLYRELVVDQQWVDQLTSVWGYQRDPGLYVLYARVRSDERIDDVEAAIARAVAALGAEPVDAAQLDRIKSHLRYAFALELDSPGSVASRLADFLQLTGEVESVNRLYRAYAAVTPAEIQALARRIFVDRNRTTVRLAFGGSRGAAAADDTGGTGGGEER